MFYLLENFFGAKDKNNEFFIMVLFIALDMSTFVSTSTHYNKQRFVYFLASHNSIISQK